MALNAAAAAGAAGSPLPQYPLPPPASAPAASVEGAPPGGYEPGADLTVASPAGAAASPIRVLSPANAASPTSAASSTPRTTILSGKGKTSTCWQSFCTRASSCLSTLSPLRGLCARTLSYLTAQAVILAVVNGTIISFTSPLTAVPVVCALVDEVLFGGDQEVRECKSLILEGIATSTIVAGAYSIYLPFKAYAIKVMPPLSDATSFQSDSTPSHSHMEMDMNTAFHMAAGIGAYCSYRITQAVQRFLYRP